MKRLSYLLCFVLSVMISVGCCSHATITNHAQPDLIHHLRDSTVSLVMVHPERGLRAYCSGVWINEKDIVTARHCVEDHAGNVTIGEVIRYAVHSNHDNKFPRSENDKSYVAKVSHYTEDSDIAIITSIDDVDHGIVKISSGTITVGMNIHIVGHPLGLQWTYFTGVVSAIRKMSVGFMDSELYTVHVTAPVMRGNSGCGAYDSDGNLIGISSFTITDVIRPSAGMSFFIHKDVLLKLLDDNGIKYYSP